MKSLDDRFMKSLADALGAFTLAALERNGDGTIPAAPEQDAGAVDRDRANTLDCAPLGEAGPQAHRT